MPSFINNSSLTSLKLSFQGEMRRMSVKKHGLTYQDLEAKTLSVFPHLTSIQFSWIDDENDRIVIGSGDELAEALRIMATEKKGYLRFEVRSNLQATDYKGSSLQASSRGRSWRRGKEQKVDQGRHCWDRSSVAQAAAARAKKKAVEDEQLEDALLEICIQESLAATSKHSASVEETGKRHQRRGGGRSGRHCWDRASVAQAAAQRAKQKECVDNRECSGKSWAAVAPRALVDQEKRLAPSPFLRKGQGRHNWDRPSVAQAAALRARHHSSVMNSMSQFHKCHKDHSQEVVPSELTSSAQGPASPQLTKRDDAKPPPPPLMKSMKWVISGSDSKVWERAPTKPPSSTSLLSLRSELCKEIALKHSKLMKQRQREDEKNAPLKWSRELKVLAQMGFSDPALSLPLLEEHLPDPCRGSAQQQAEAERGLQAVVLALLPG